MSSTVTVKAPLHGAHVILTSGASWYLGPFEEREISRGLLPLFVNKGCDVVGGSAPAPEPRMSEEEAREKLKQAITVLVKEGDPDNFTKSGEPDRRVLRKMVGFTPPEAMTIELFAEVIDELENAD